MEQQQFSYAPQQYVSYQKKPGKGMAIAGLVLSIIGLLLFPLLLILLIPLFGLFVLLLVVPISLTGFILQSVAAFRTVKRGFAITGLVLGLVGLEPLSIIFLAIAGFGQPKVQAQPQPIINQYFGQNTPNG